MKLTQLCTALLLEICLCLETSDVLILVFRCSRNNIKPLLQHYFQKLYSSLTFGEKILSLFGKKLFFPPATPRLQLVGGQERIRDLQFRPWTLYKMWFWPYIISLLQGKTVFHRTETEDQQNGLSFGPGYVTSIRISLFLGKFKRYYWEGLKVTTELGELIDGFRHEEHLEHNKLQNPLKKACHNCNSLCGLSPVDHLHLLLNSVEKDLSEYKRNDIYLELLNFDYCILQPVPIFHCTGTLPINRKFFLRGEFDGRALERNRTLTTSFTFTWSYSKYTPILKIPTDSALYRFVVNFERGGRVSKRHRQ